VAVDAVGELGAAVVFPDDVVPAAGVVPAQVRVGPVAGGVAGDDAVGDGAGGDEVEDPAAGGIAIEPAAGNGVVHDRAVGHVHPARIIHRDRAAQRFAHVHERAGLHDRDGVAGEGAVDGGAGGVSELHEPAAERLAVEIRLRGD